MAKEKTENQDKLLEDVLKQIEREYGKGSIMKLGERPAVDVEPIHSGSLLLDQALGIGGYPKGRIIEIYGPESMRLRKYKSREGVRLLSMQKMPSILSMPVI